MICMDLCVVVVFLSCASVSLFSYMMLVCIDFKMGWWHNNACVWWHNPSSHLKSSI
jgi:hypothetical protein